VAKPPGVDNQPEPLEISEASAMLDTDSATLSATQALTASLKGSEVIGLARFFASGESQCLTGPLGQL